MNINMLCNAEKRDACFNICRQIKCTILVLQIN